ncbi:MAG TPA: M12 family metallo-peptidase [Verrucomicrobiae bacterium]
MRTRLEGLPAAAKNRAVGWLRNFHFTELDLNSLEADADGGIFYADKFSLDLPADQPAAAEPVTAQAALPVSPFPASLIFHSKPGAPNIIFLNFGGENVTNTAWNTSQNETVIPAVAFSTDSDFSTFSDLEQTAIKRIWERVSEDYAPFNADVTTERPATFGNRVANALITRNTDANGNPNPSSSAGGISYVNVFGGSGYASYRPCWIYYNNLSGSESYIAEATSHEVGHNMGLSHDGKTDGTEYYSGHGSGNISWGPLMGTGYNRNVSQWSKGEYYLANNSQDDLAIIAGKLSYRADDHGNTQGTATALVLTSVTNIVSTTPESDPANTNSANKGILEQTSDVDVFSFTTGNGPINITVNPWIMPAGTRGGNADLLVELHDSTGALLMTNNPGTDTFTQIQMTLSQGTYYLYIRSSGAGDPSNSVPSGYTSYGSIGQYFINGYITPSGASQPSVHLSAAANNPNWGSVSPSNATFTAGAVAQVVATPAPYYRFAGWTNGASGTNDPLMVVLTNNFSVQANFAEITTTNYPTPYWWLAAYGVTNNFERGVTNIGANGMALWQSFLAGLDPANPASQLRIALSRGNNGAANVLNWSTVTGRVYTVWWSTNAIGVFQRLAGASNLSANVHSFTNNANMTAPSIFYKLQVQ